MLLGSNIWAVKFQFGHVTAKVQPLVAAESFLFRVAVVTSEQTSMYSNWSKPIQTKGEYDYSEAFLI